MKFCLGMKKEPTDSLWVRIKERTENAAFLVGVYYRSPDQEEQEDEAL